MELGKYIITDGNRSVGTLSLRRDGLYTLLEASAETREGLTRLYISGGGQSACLGLMTPDSGLVKLRRRLSRLELKNLPERIETASTCPPENTPKSRPKPAEEKPDAQPATPVKGWRPMPDGSLVLSKPDGKYLALPAKLRRVPPGIRLCVINGQEYLVFRY